MEGFREYLKTRYHYTDNSLEIKINHVELYQRSCSVNQQLAYLSFTELLKIIEIQRSRYRIATVNNQLHSLKCYYFYQIKLENRSDNPLDNFSIQSEKAKMLQGFLSPEELDFIYENYPLEAIGRNKIYLMRNKIILGLMIYQGLSTGTLANLKISDINLEKGQINVPKSSERKLNPRILSLESVQIIALYNYLKEDREGLLIKTNSDTNTDLLFPKRGISKMRATTKVVKEDVQRYFKIEGIYQLRISRILFWLNHYNIREVQYKSGYKRLSSLEKYRHNELESLKQAVEKYHIF